MSAVRVEILDETYEGWAKHLYEQLHGRQVSATKLDVFHAFRRSAAREASARFRHRRASLADIESLATRDAGDFVLIVPDWKVWNRREHELVERLERVAARPDRPRIGLLDTVDQSSTPFLPCLPHVDVFVKSQLFRDRSTYTREFAGSYLIAEWCRDFFDFDLADWRFGSVTAPEYLDRLWCGWNMGTSRFYRAMLRLTRRAAKPWRQRRLDVNRRFPVPDRATASKWEWYQEYPEILRGPHRRSRRSLPVDRRRSAPTSPLSA